MHSEHSEICDCEQIHQDAVSLVPQSFASAIWPVSST